MLRSAGLLGVSNAIVDVLSHVPYETLTEMGAEPGSMTLIDAAQAAHLSDTLTDTQIMSGGSVSNSVAAFGALGGSAAYIGRVADDALGATFAADMAALGVDMRLPPETRVAPTARSFVLITPDGQRTMRTFLGACTEIETSDISAQTVGAPERTLLEGYLWDTPQGYAVADAVVNRTLEANGSVVLSLSDAECVKRHHDAFAHLVHMPGNIVVGNETEFAALLGTSDISVMAQKLGKFAAETTAVITRSEKGCVIVEAGAQEAVDATPVDRVIDTTGAGDAFCGAYLYGLSTGQTHEQAAALGGQCAATVVQQVGARYLP